jgi:DNA mismatch endonuclease (patch repair protein)
MADNRTPQQRRENMQAVHGKNTAPELFVRSMLHRLGYRFRLHRKDLPGTPDIVFPRRRSVIFVHGCFWHGHNCPRGNPPSSNADFWLRKIASNRERDGRTQKRLRKDGWKVLTVWECETRNQCQLEQRVSQFLEQSPAEGRRKALSE